MAQSVQSDTRCPTVSVSFLDGYPNAPGPWSYVATVGNASPDLKLSYDWTARNGQIVDGQGTPQVKVLGNRVRRLVVNRDGRIVEELELESFTATVTVKGVAPQCSGTTASMSYIPGIAPAITKADEFGALSFQQVKIRLDAFAQMFRIHPGSAVYIVSEGKWSLQKRAFDYLVKKQGLNAERLTYVEKKKTDQLTVKLYLIPQGASPPN